jgi:hypothetical protein
MLSYIGGKIGLLTYENKLKAFGNKMTRRLFGSEKQEVTGGSGKLHSQVLHDFH